MVTGKSRRTDAAVPTKATIRVADNLGISQKVLASVVGLSEPTVSRMRRGAYVLKPDSGKAFELALLLVQLGTLIERLVFQDRDSAKAWMVAENTALHGQPIHLIQNAQGLVRVVSYLRYRLN